MPVEFFSTPTSSCGEPMRVPVRIDRVPVKDVVLLDLDQNGATQMEPLEVVRAVEVQLDPTVGLRAVEIEVAETEVKVGGPDRRISLFHPRPEEANLFRCLGQRWQRHQCCRNAQREHGQPVD